MYRQFNSLHFGTKYDGFYLNFGIVMYNFQKASVLEYILRPILVAVVFAIFKKINVFKVMVREDECVSFLFI